MTEGGIDWEGSPALPSQSKFIRPSRRLPLFHELAGEVAEVDGERDDHPIGGLGGLANAGPRRPRGGRPSPGAIGAVGPKPHHQLRAEEPLEPIAPLGCDPQSLVEEVLGVSSPLRTAGYAHYRKNIPPENPPGRRNFVLT